MPLWKLYLHFEISISISSQASLVVKGFQSQLRSRLERSGCFGTAISRRQIPIVPCFLGRTDQPASQPARDPNFAYPCPAVAHVRASLLTYLFVSSQRLRRTNSARSWPYLQSYITLRNSFKISSESSVSTSKISRPAVISGSRSSSRLATQDASQYPLRAGPVGQHHDASTSVPVTRVS